MESYDSARAREMAESLSHIKARMSELAFTSWVESEQQDNGAKEAVSEAERQERERRAERIAKWQETALKLEETISLLTSIS